MVHGFTADAEHLLIFNLNYFYLLHGILNQEDEDEEEQVVENHRVEVITRQEQIEDYNEQ